MTHSVPTDVVLENPEILSEKKHEFRHAAGGRHLEPEIVCECGKPCKSGECPACKDKTKPKLVPVVDAVNNPRTKNGKPLMRVATKDVPYGKNCPYGDTFKSNVELDVVHNRKEQPPKFVRLDEDHNPDSYALHEEQRKNEKLLAERRRLFERMNREQLQEYAEQELGMNFTGKAARREAILEAILKHEAEAVPA